VGKEGGKEGGREGGRAYLEVVEAALETIAEHHIEEAVGGREGKGKRGREG
jgi:hypothetical protein